MLARRPSALNAIDIVNHVVGDSGNAVVDAVAAASGGVDLGPIIAKILRVLVAEKRSHAIPRERYRRILGCGRLGRRQRAIGSAET
jgi:hypothetical protein